MKTGALKKLVIVILIIIMIIPTATVKAEGEREKRFSFEEYELKNGEAEFGENSMTLTVRKNCTLSFDLAKASYKKKPNAIRIKLANHTENEELSVRLTFGEKNERVEKIPAAKQSDARYYYIYDENADKIQHIKIYFGKKSGTVTVYSIKAVSTYEKEKTEACGDITSCKYNSESKTLTFTGNIDKNTQAERIKIYRLNEAEELSFDEKSPVVDERITERFNFKVNAGDGKGILKSRYIAYCEDEAGERKLLAGPFYADITDVKTDPGAKKDLKGAVYTDDSATVMAGIGITVAELDINRLLNTDGGSFIEYGKKFRFNRKMTEELEKRISTLSASGVDVLLRIEGFEEAKKEEFAAAIDFIGEKWLTNGYADGLILGTRENQSTDNVKTTVECLHTLKEAAASRNLNTQVYLSTGEILNDELNVYGYPAIDEYITEIGKLQRRMGSFPFGLCIEDDIDSDNGTVTADIRDSGSITELFDAAGLNCSGLLFCDRTYSQAGEMTLEESVLHYAKSYSDMSKDSKVMAYIAYLPEKCGDLLNCIEYIGTNRVEELYSGENAVIGEEISVPVLENLEIQHELSFRSENFCGKYLYYDCTKSSDRFAFEKSFGCTDTEDGYRRMFSATLSGKGSGYAYTGISKTFEFKENFIITPVIKIKLKVDSDNIGEIPLKIIFTSEKNRLIYKDSIKCGQLSSFYVNVSRLEGAEKADSMKIYLDGTSFENAVLSVDSITGYSFVKSDAELKLAVDENHLSQKAKNVFDDKQFLAVCMGAVGFITLMIILFMFRHSKSQGSEHSEAE